MEFKYGQMEQGTRATGSTTKPVARVNSGMLTETYSRVNGRKIKPMGMESMCI